MTTGGQLYTAKPTSLADVRGESSQTIFRFMTQQHVGFNCWFPTDVDDWERNRALLLCYPEWRARLHEMAILSPQWKKLTDNWTNLEAKYEEDVKKFGDKAHKGECDQLIKKILSNTPKPKIFYINTEKNDYKLDIKTKQKTTYSFIGKKPEIEAIETLILDVAKPEMIEELFVTIAKIGNIKQ